MSAALAYRAQAPVLDGLMKELGLDGSSLGGLAAAAAKATKAVEEAVSKLTFLNDESSGDDAIDGFESDEAAE